MLVTSRVVTGVRVFAVGKTGTRVLPVLQSLETFNGRDVQIFQNCRSHLKIPGAKMVT